jgi:hypothetical protein
MNRGIGLLIGITALGVIATAADAADGCGPGRYYNGYRCVSQGYGPPQDRGPGLLFDFGGRNDQRYQPSRRYNTWNGCPPRYTIQDGVCKPYTGR